MAAGIKGVLTGNDLSVSSIGCPLVRGKFGRACVAPVVPSSQLGRQANMRGNWCRWGPTVHCKTIGWDCQ